MAIASFRRSKVNMEMSFDPRILRDSLRSRCERADLVALAFAKHIAVFLQRAANELSLLPQVGREESVGAGDGSEGGLERVLERLGRTGRSSVAVVDTRKLTQTLYGWRCDETSTTRGRDELKNVSQLH